MQAVTDKFNIAKTGKKWLNLALLAAAIGVGPMAMAQAPMVKTQPGYYRLMLGQFEVTALNDGTTQLAADKLLSGISPAALTQALAGEHLRSPVETSFNAFLINTGSKLILIDAGTGPAFGPDSGHLLQSLKAAGYTPEQVDEIYLTHLHLDHIGGLSDGTTRAFPNAVVRVDKKDADYWLDPVKEAAAADAAKPYFDGAIKVLKPYIAAGKFVPFDRDQVLTPGISSKAEPGHTAGHDNFLIESDGQKLMVVADLIHVGAVQFPHPEVTIGFDSDAKQAASERRTAFDQAAQQGYLVAGAHLSFPGIGHIDKSGNGYRWLPINYSLAR